MNLTLQVWRQKGPNDKGKFEQYQAQDIDEHMSFLEMLDVVNEDLIKQGKEPIVFDHDCREGICGMCSQMINGIAHGPDEEITVCQLHMRKFKDGDRIVIEPWRAKAFPVVKDVMVDRSALDRIIQSYGYTAAHTGGVPDGNALPVSKVNADLAMDAAAALPPAPTPRPCSSFRPR
jgi:succinate dehydrogenase / fumarate reductase iron-sulfur subunit